MASRSVLVGQHDRDNSLGHRRVGWIGGMMGEGPIKIVDLEKDRFAFDFERPEIVFFVRVIGVAEVIEHGDRLDNSVDSFLAEGGDARSDDGSAANQMVAQVVVERTNPVGLTGWSWHFS